MSRRLVTDAERRARLGRRQVLEPRAAGSVEELVDRLLVLHATDPATIYLSVGARRPGTTPADVDDALFARRSLYRTMVMRRTLFVCTTDLGPDIEGASAPAVARSERKRLEKFLGDTELSAAQLDGLPPEPAAWLAAVFGRVLAALDGPGVGPGGLGQEADGRGGAESDDRGGRTARQLTADVPALTTKLIAGKGTRQEMELAATSRVLGLMAVEGLLVRGRPTTTWTGRQYRWYRRDRWWDGGAGPVPEADGDAARGRVLDGYLRRFGPATLTDLVWWTGWTKTQTRAALATFETVEVEIDGEVPGGGVGEEPGLLLADDADPVEAPEPWAALLPSLDPTPMGWKQRRWYLGGHQGPLFDRNGNVGPTVWVDGRIVGGWSQRPDGEVVVSLLEEIEADERRLIEAERRRIQDFVGPVVVRPSFPTPLQRELSER